MLVGLCTVKGAPTHFRGLGEPRGPQVASLLPAIQTPPSLRPLHLSVSEAGIEWGPHGGPRASGGGRHWAQRS